MDSASVVACAPDRFARFHGRTDSISRSRAVEECSMRALLPPGRVDSRTSCGDTGRSVIPDARRLFPCVSAITLFRIQGFEPTGATQSPTRFAGGVRFADSCGPARRTPYVGLCLHPFTRPALGAALGLTFALLVGSALPARAQAEDKPRNLKVLPADLSRDSVVKIMRLTVATGLGVTCGYCHGAPGVLFDSIASDGRQTKRTAREMRTR